MTDGQRIAGAYVEISPDVSAMRNVGAQIKAALGPVSAQLSDVGRSLSTYVTLPMAAAGAASVKLAGDFERSINRISALGEIAGKPLEDLRAQAMKLGADTQFSAKEAADAMGELAAAGFDAQQIYKSMPGVLSLAAAGELKVAQAADIAVGIMGGFSLAAEQSGHAADVLAKAAASGAVSVQEMGMSMKYIGAVASAAGLSFEEMSAAVTMLSNAGIRGEQAGTSLRGALNALLNPSKEAAGVLDRLGIVSQTAGGKLLPFADIIQQLQEKGASVSDVFKIFGAEAASGIQALVSKGAPALRFMTQELVNSEGAAKAMADILKQGFAGTWEQFTGSVETAGIALGSVLMPAATGVLEILTKLANAFTSLDPVLKTFAAVVGVAAAAIGPLLLGLAGIISISPAVGAAWVAITGPVGLLSIAIAGLVAAAATIYAKWEPITAWFHREFTKLNISVNEFAASVASAFGFEGVAENFRRIADEARKELRSIRGLVDEVQTNTDLRVAGQANAALATLRGRLGSNFSGSPLADAAAFASAYTPPPVVVPPPGGGGSGDPGKVAATLEQIAGAARRLRYTLLGAFGTDEISTFDQRVKALAPSLQRLRDIFGDAGVAGILGGRMKPKGLEGGLSGAANGEKLDPVGGLRGLDWERPASAAEQGYTKLEEILIRMRVRLADAAAGIAESIRAGLSDAVVAFAEGVGQVAAGAGGMGDVFRLVLDALAGMAIQVGKIAIGVGIAVGGIKKALESLNPVVAIAAGIALVALGTIARTALANAASGDVEGGRANGGTVWPGKWLVGERGPEIVDIPASGFVHSNASLRAGMNGQGGGTVHHSFSPFRIQGDELVALVERTVMDQLEGGRGGLLAKLARSV